MGQLGKRDLRDPVGNGVEHVVLHMLQLTHMGSSNASRRRESRAFGDRRLTSAFGRLIRVEWSFSCVVQERASLHTPGRSILVLLLRADGVSSEGRRNVAFVSTLFHC